MSLSQADSMSICTYIVCSNLQCPLLPPFTFSDRLVVLMHYPSQLAPSQSHVTRASPIPRVSPQEYIYVCKAPSYSYLSVPTSPHARPAMANHARVLFSSKFFCKIEIVPVAELEQIQRGCACLVGIQDFIVWVQIW